MQQKIREMLMSVRCPFRYAGGEVGARAKDWDRARIRICLAFPDVYEIGMSHLGLSILYHIINDEPNMLAERVFAPWADMEAELEKRGMPLFSIESHRPISDFDIVGFSLAYELTYTNVLTMLRLAGIPWRANERDDSHPFIIAGGPCAFNPMPVAPFFDAVVIGDGEKAIIEIANAVRESKKSSSNGCHSEPSTMGIQCSAKNPEASTGSFAALRMTTKRGVVLDKLSKIKGVYVPHLDVSIDHWPSTIDCVGKSHVQDLDNVSFPKVPVVPHAATQERAAVEVSRGCSRGCRFCQAGFIYRPVRQRSGDVATQIACEQLRSTGAEDFSFLSLSIGDWTPLEVSLKSVHENMRGMPVNASLPSLRAESLSQSIIESLGKARAGSFTLAPEAATERMRKFINKGNTDGDLYSSVENVFKNGWHAIKLYFMIGLPGETDEEIEGIIKIANKCLDIGRRLHRRPEVTVSTSTFIPKAHTPFQWNAQISIEEAERIQKILKAKLKRPGLYYRWHDAGMSFLEGIFARGGLELARVIEIAHENGARFDGWDENFDLERWKDAFAQAGIDPERYSMERESGEIFPWEFLGVGPSRKFLLKERERANELLSTADCTKGECLGCGICDGREIKNLVAQNVTEDCHSRGRKAVIPQFNCGIPLIPRDSAVKPRNDTSKYRLRYKKTGQAAFLGSIETLDALRRSFRISGINICYTEGYHPRAKVSAGPALPVGIESEAEFIDIELYGQVDEKGLVQMLKDSLPQGMEIVEAAVLGDGSPSIENALRAVHYEVSETERGVDLQAACASFNLAGAISYKRIRGEKAVDVDLKDYVEELAVLDDNVLGVVIRNKQPAMKISEIIATLLSVDVEDTKLMMIRKSGVVWNRSDEKTMTKIQETITKQ